MASMEVSRVLRTRPGIADDVLLTLAVAGVTAAAQAADLRGPGGTPLDPLGWLLTPVLGGLLLVRRRFPVASAGPC